MDLVTRATLVSRLGDPEDNEAWYEFVGLYGGMIHGYARRKGLPEYSADDVLQEVLARLMKRMEAFEYRRKEGGNAFRSYLLRIAHGCIVDEFRTAGKHVLLAPSDDGKDDPFERLADESEDAALSTECDRVWFASVLAQGLERARGKVKRTTFEAFRAYVLNGEDAETVAARYSIEVNALYQMRHRVIDLLRREVKRILAEADELDAFDHVMVADLAQVWQPDIEAAYTRTRQLAAEGSDWLKRLGQDWEDRA
jgi:RNA polymerase sigma factor (sigma-70 family)